MTEKIKMYLINNHRIYRLLIIAVILFWAKTYYVQKYLFKLSLENPMQEFILFISPVAFILFSLGLLTMFPKKSRDILLLIYSFVSSCALFGNVLFYRFYTDFVTVPVLMQTSNASDLGGSVASLLKFSDLLMFLDFGILLLLVIFAKDTVKHIRIKSSVFIMVLSSFILFFNLTLAESERPQLLTRTFDREMLVKFLGIYNYHVYDIYMQSKTTAQKAFAEESTFNEVKEYMNTKESNVNIDSNYKGIAEGKNVVYIALESLQTFLINEKLEGEEITPFLNSLIKDSYYFPNFYHQTAQGKSSDSEFLLDTSWYPLNRGAVYFTHANNTYQGLPSLLGKKGYSTNVYHANNKSFWNRDMMYNAMGYTKYYDLPYYQVTDENSVGWGLKDIPFFDQSVEMLKKLESPYTARLITLTNHHPFDLAEEDMVIKPWNSNSKTLNKYFTTVNYMDRAVEKFFNSMKNEGLYEDTMFVLYGDHYGISENHNRAMAKYLNKKSITQYDVASLQKVPAWIVIPGVTDGGNGEVFEQTNGQIDLKPTLMHLLGLETTENDLLFGENMFSKNTLDTSSIDNVENVDIDKLNPIVFRDGSAVSDVFVWKDNTCYIHKELGKLVLTDEELISEEINVVNYENKYLDYLKENNILVESITEVNNTDLTTLKLLTFEDYKKVYKEKLVTGYQIDSTYCKSLKTYATNELKYNDLLIYGDLLRFQ